MPEQKVADLKNASISQDGDDLVIRINTKGETKESRSGQSNLICTTSGNLPLAVGGKILKLSMNLFDPK
jgi:hypothetical protein